MNYTESKEELDALLTSSRSRLTAILIMQTICFLVAVLALMSLNLSWFELNLGKYLYLANSALFAYCGSCIYFSRKCYTYLITDKFRKIALDDDRIPDIIAFRSVLRGYYLYLVVRPSAGLLIGPILSMLSFAGLLTFSGLPVEETTEVSQGGRYFVYAIGFLAGHASSDILDYFTRLARKVVIGSTD